MATWRRGPAPMALSVILLAAVCGQCCFGETPKRGWKKVWAVSVAAVLAANVADANSSIGRGECNPLLRNAQGGLSGQRAVLVKTAGTGGMLLLQYVLHRKIPNQGVEKPAALINFAAAAAVGGVAYRNSRIPKRVAPAP